MTEQNSIVDIFTIPQAPEIGDIISLNHKNVPAGWVLVTGQKLMKSEYPQIYEKYYAREGWYTEYDYFNLSPLVTPIPEVTGYYIYLGK